MEMISINQLWLEKTSKSTSKPEITNDQQFIRKINMGRRMVLSMDQGDQINQEDREEEGDSMVKTQIRREEAGKEAELIRKVAGEKERIT